MAYRFARQSDVKRMDEWCRTILFDVQNEVRDYFTFDIRIIGSGDRRLVTQNGDEPFDLDYNIILQKDKYDLLGTPGEIKRIFRNAFKKIMKKYVKDYNYVSDSTSVITCKIIIEDELIFSFDVAILVEWDNGKFYRLIHDKNHNRYIWNEVKDSKNYYEKFLNIKEQGMWMKFKQRYLDLKNMHLRRQDDIKSFSVFLETLNEFLL